MLQTPEEHAHLMYLALAPYPPAHETLMWRYTHKMLECVQNDLVCSIVLKCMCSMLLPCSTGAFDMSYSGMLERNVGLIRRDEVPGLLGDVGVRYANGKLTLCYLSGVLMCDLDFQWCAYYTTRGEPLAVLRKVRRVMFRLLKRLAYDYADVVDASTAAALDTPNGMHVYFARVPDAPLDRMFEFLKQTNDPKYVFAYAMDMDRGFCDKVAAERVLYWRQTCYSSTGQSVVSHADMATAMTHPGLTPEDMDVSAMLPLFKLRARVASLFAVGTREQTVVKRMQHRLRLLYDSPVAVYMDEYVARREHDHSRMMDAYRVLICRLLPTYVRARLAALVSLCAIAYQPCTTRFDVPLVQDATVGHNVRILHELAKGRMETEDALREFAYCNQRTHGEQRIFPASFEMYMRIRRDVGGLVKEFPEDYGILEESDDTVTLPRVMDPVVQRYKLPLVDLEFRAARAYTFAA